MCACKSELPNIYGNVIGKPSSLKQLAELIYHEYLVCMRSLFIKRNAPETQTLLPKWDPLKCGFKLPHCVGLLSLSTHFPEN